MQRFFVHTYKNERLQTSKHQEETANQYLARRDEQENWFLLKLLIFKEEIDNTFNVTSNY